jgi:hypothetical protein
LYWSSRQGLAIPTAIGGVYFWSITNNSGNAQTIATTNTTPTLSYSLADGAKSLVKITQVGGDVYAQQEI